MGHGRLARAGRGRTTFDKAAYLVRTKALMDRIVTVDSLDTHIDAVKVAGRAATVDLTQTMERHERDATTGVVSGVRLRYRERHEWVQVADGWRVKSVTMVGAAERTPLAAGR